MLWLIFATYLVNSFETYLEDGSFSVDNPVHEVDDSGDSNLDKIKSMSNTFINAISFRVVGLPDIISLLFFTVPTLIFAYMSIDILIAFLDAILPF